jgi:hypothetical protein
LDLDSGGQPDENDLPRPPGAGVGNRPEGAPLPTIGLTLVGIEQLQFRVVGCLELSEPLFEFSASDGWVFHLSHADAIPKLVDLHVEKPQFDGCPDFPRSCSKGVSIDFGPSSPFDDHRDALLESLEFDRSLN